MTVLQQFSDELILAARRQDRRQASRRRRARAGASAAAAVLTLGAVAAAAATLWSPQLGDDHRGHPSSSTTAPPPAQLAALGVLRRAQNAADRGAQSTYALALLDPSLQGVRTAYVRLLGSQTDGRGFVLIPVASYSTQDGAGATIPDALCLFAQDIDGGGLGCYTTQQLLQGSAVGALLTATATTSPAPDSSASAPAGSHFQRASAQVGAGVFYGLVPDGVASVTLTSDQGSLTVAVHDNFFQAPLPAGAGMPTVTWLDSDGAQVAMAPR